MKPLNTAANTLTNTTLRQIPDASSSEGAPGIPYPEAFHQKSTLLRLSTMT